MGWVWAEESRAQPWRSPGVRAYVRARVCACACACVSVGWGLVAAASSRAAWFPPHAARVGFSPPGGVRGELPGEGGTQNGRSSKALSGNRARQDSAATPWQHWGTWVQRGRRCPDASGLKEDASLRQGLCRQAPESVSRAGPQAREGRGWAAPSSGCSAPEALVFSGLPVPATSSPTHEFPAPGRHHQNAANGRLRPGLLTSGFSVHLST